jgi:hypothetical protein
MRLWIVCDASARRRGGAAKNQHITHVPQAKTQTKSAMRPHDARQQIYYLPCFPYMLCNCSHGERGCHPLRGYSEVSNLINSHLGHQRKK